MSSAPKDVPTLTEKQRRLLELLIEKKGAGLKQTSRIRRRDQSVNYPPLSFAQQRLWFLDQLVPNSPFYNVPAAIRISAPLSVNLLRATLNEIVKRHEVLRTSFGEAGGKPFQIIAQSLNVPFEARDLRSLDSAIREEVGFRIATEEAQRPFDLRRGPLIRALLLRLDEQDYVFLINLHHIVADGWSMGVMVEEFRKVYGALAEGSRSPLPELPIQYADFAVWQQNRLETGQLHEQMKYWTAKLNDLPLLQLPTDFPHRDVQGFEGETLYATLPLQLSSEVRSFSQRNAVTVYVTLFAAFNALLYRYTGQDEIVIGEPVANRNQVELEPLIGFFVNSLVLRTDVSGDPTFRELLQRSRKEVLEADANQDIPFEVLVDRLKPERTMGRNPLFQVSLQYFSGAEANPHEAILPSEAITIEKGTASLDLAFDLTDSAQGIVARVEYSTELFRRETIERMISHYQNLLQAFIENPELRISKAPMLSSTETQQLLVGWNPPVTISTTVTLVHELFKAQASRTPDSVAVASGSRRLSYRQLNERANQLAQVLQAEGIGSEKLVAICMNRSIDVVVAVLAVWKAGGAYIPVDPMLPAERFRFVLTDAQPTLIVTDCKLTEQRAGLHTPIVLISDERIAEATSENFVSPSGPENLAYVIYTSGSSGTPKGVMVENGALSKHLQWMQSEFPLGPEDRTLFKYSFSFDVAVLEMFWPLLAGAEVEVLESDGPLDISRMARLIQDRAITVIDVVPSMLAALLESPQFTGSKSLRRVICGGEIMSRDLLNRLLGHLNVEFVNMYGPTETTITATYSRGTTVGDERVPIGRPATPYTAYVLDRDLNLSPVGVPGELYLGGHCLARGYLGQPELTRQRFIRDPFSHNAVGRLYRTGDQCRLRADGNLEFLGRMDAQVKVRGYRIELGEVEAVLASSPAVRSCAVHVVSIGGHSQLAAYVVSNLGPPEFWPSVGEYFLYDELLYAIMTTDRVRTRAYRSAIEGAVRGKIVVDIGTGADLALARMCLDAGARRVYALEMLESAYQKASRLERELDVGDRLVLIHGKAQDSTLPEKADVCVSELIGTIGSSEGVVEILNDAHRFLRPGGEMIPQRCVTKIAAVSLPDDLVTRPRVSEIPRHYLESIFESRGRRFDIRLCVKNLPSSCIVSDASTFEELVFDRKNDLEQSTEFQLVINRDCRVDGFLLWINLFPSSQELIDILASECSWLPLFLPVFSPGIQVSAGDRVSAVASRLVEPEEFTPDYLIRGAIKQGATGHLDFSYESRRNETSCRSNSFYRAFHDALEKGDTSSVEDLSEERRRVRQWGQIYEDLYAKSAVPRDRDFDIVGWDSSYTGRPFSRMEMGEQVDATVKRISSLGGKSVLEIGCGTGLLLLRLAATCERYTGTDFSPGVIEQLRQVVDERGWSHVELWDREADNLEGWSPESFDVVVLNSVVQYFPSMDYLVRVIQGAARVLRPGGYIYVGDVRSLPLLKLLNAGIEIERCTRNTSVRELHVRLERRMREEQELIIDPDFFRALLQLENITGVSIQLKRGWEDNELTCFRYDVFVQVNSSARSLEGCAELEWSEVANAATLRDHLRENAPPLLLVRGVPSARLQARQRALEAIEQGEPAATVESLSLEQIAASGGVEPEEFWALESELPYEFQIDFSGRDNPANYDLLCIAQGKKVNEPTMWGRASRDTSPRPWSSYANTVRQHTAQQDREKTLRQYLNRKLPEYMIPSTFVWMDTLPLTPSGKVNRPALPAPDASRFRLDEEYAPPETESQRQTASIWRQVLGLERIGIDSNFFNIGGHSLLAMQVISRLNDLLNLEIPLRLMFEVPTIRGLTDAIVDLQAAANQRNVPRLAPARDHIESDIDLEKLTDEQVDALISGLLVKGALS